LAGVIGDGRLDFSGPVLDELSRGSLQLPKAKTKRISNVESVELRRNVFIPLAYFDEGSANVGWKTD
jgi:hypothetical protein